MEDIIATFPESPDEYSYKEGDHWIESVIFSLEALTKDHTCSPELHILLGIARGVKTGTITKGDYFYTEIATKATVDGDLDICSELMNLAANGLFTNGILPGAEEIQPIIDHPNHLDLQNWQGGFEDGIFNCDGVYNSPQGAILQGIMVATENETVRYGDHRYVKLAIEAVSGCRDQKYACRNLENFAELGFFGSELIHGCEPDRSSAVSRLK